MEDFLEENIYVFDIFNNNDEIEYAELNSKHKWIWNNKHNKYYRFLTEDEYNKKIIKYNDSYNCGIAACDNYFPCQIHIKDNVLSCGCVACNYEVYMNIPYDKNRFIKNYENNHCFTCHCKNCVCPARMINKQFNDKIKDTNRCNIISNCNKCYDLMEELF